MSNVKARTRGRPRSREKARLIMNSAMELFTSKGYEGTSIDDIAAAAGVSRQTVYTHYGCKENLFGLAVATKCKTSGIDPEAIDSGTPPEEMLPVIARRFLQLITSREAVKVHAVCTGSADTHPELGQVYFDRGPRTTVEIVAAYLAEQDRAGRLRVENPEHAAWQLLCMLKAEAQLRTQFNLERMAEEDTKAYIDSCVAMFLRAYAPA